MSWFRRYIVLAGKKSDPAYHSYADIYYASLWIIILTPADFRVIPMRSPMLWSDTILASLASRSAYRDPTPPPPPPSDPLPPRHGYDSYSELVLPFASNKQLFEQYTNASGGIQTGKLMEHLDSLAGSISYKHVLGRGVELLACTQERGFYIATASVDRYGTALRINFIDEFETFQNLASTCLHPSIQCETYV